MMVATVAISVLAFNAYAEEAVETEVCDVVAVESDQAEQEDEIAAADPAQAKKLLEEKKSGCGCGKPKN